MTTEQANLEDRKEICYRSFSTAFLSYKHMATHVQQ